MRGVHNRHSYRKVIGKIIGILPASDGIGENRSRHVAASDGEDINEER